MQPFARGAIAIHRSTTDGPMQQCTCRDVRDNTDTRSISMPRIMERQRILHNDNHAHPTVKRRMPGFRKWIWLAGWVAVSINVSHAQTVTSCPPGMVSYGAGVCGYEQSQDQEAAPPAPATPRPRWMTTWGAITSSFVPTGVLGIATLFPSESAAIQAAMQDCRSKGGTECKIELTYYNQCAAVIVGHPGYVVETGETPDETVDKSMSECVSAGNKNCRVLYSGCSLALKIQ